MSTCRRSPSPARLREVFAAGREALAFLAQRMTSYDFFHEGQRHGVAVSVIYSPEEVLGDPQLVERGFPGDRPPRRHRPDGHPPRGTVPHAGVALARRRARARAWASTSTSSASSGRAPPRAARRRPGPLLLAELEDPHRRSPRRNLGHTSSFSGTSRSSVKMRSRVSPIG